MAEAVVGWGWGLVGGYPGGVIWANVLNMQNLFSPGAMEEYPLDVIEGAVYPNTTAIQFEAREIRRCLLEGNVNQRP